MRRIFTLKLLFIVIAFGGSGLLAYKLYATHDLRALRFVNLQQVVLLGALAVCLQLVGHWLRALKHRYLLEQIRPIRTIEVFKGQMIGFLFNAILPFRLGELVRAHYIGKGVAISRSAVLATILFERWLDTVFLSILGLLVLASFTFVSPALTYVVTILFASCFVLGFLLFAARSQHGWLLKIVYHVSGQFNQRIRDRVRMVAWSAVYCLKSVITTERMPRYVGLSAVMWVSYLLSSLAMICAVLTSLNLFDKAVSVTSVYFGVSVPSGPAWLDTFEHTFSSIAHIPHNVSGANYAPIALWLLLITPASLLGLLALVMRQRTYGDSQATDVDALKNKLHRDADITKEFSRFLSAYFRGETMNRLLAAEELANNFRVIKTFKGASHALTILAWQENAMVVKKIILKQFESKLKYQFAWLKERAKMPQIANVISEHHDNNGHYAIDIEYRDDHVPFFDFIHSTTTAKSRKVLEDVCAFVAGKIHVPLKTPKNPKRILNDYIKTKTEAKVTDASKAHPTIAKLLDFETVEINGQEFLNFKQILQKITASKRAMSDLVDFVDCPIHGDLTIDNIIVNPSNNNFILLDPNNENAISDPIVDYAKLLQGLHSGYDFLIDLETCEVKNNQITFEECRSVQYEQLDNALRKQLAKQLPASRYRALLFHEAVHYCRMLTYKVEINPQTAPAFYGIAVRLLNEFMGQYKRATKA